MDYSIYGQLRVHTVFYDLVILLTAKDDYFGKAKFVSISEISFHY